MAQEPQLPIVYSCNQRSRGGLQDWFLYFAFACTVLSKSSYCMSQFVQWHSVGAVNNTALLHLFQLELAFSSSFRYSFGSGSQWSHAPVTSTDLTGSQGQTKCVKSRWVARSLESARCKLGSGEHWLWNYTNSKIWNQVCTSKLHCKHLDVTYARRNACITWVQKHTHRLMNDTSTHKGTERSERKCRKNRDL